MAVGSGPIVNALVKHIPWQDIILFPNYLIIYYWFLIAPSISGLIMSTIYFVKHKKLRQATLRNLKELIFFNNW